MINIHAWRNVCIGESKRIDTGHEIKCILNTLLTQREFRYHAYIITQTKRHLHFPQSPWLPGIIVSRCYPDHK